MPRTLTQPPLFAVGQFPTTRYQGSKRKLAATILSHLRRFEFSTVLDAFGGTGAVAHAFKAAGKQVTYNDLLAFNHQVGVALIENDSILISDDDVDALCKRHGPVAYDDFIEEHFDGIYYTREENRWLDAAVGNIGRIPCRYKRALAWFALFQAAMAKRPYNLFHRRNLYMRTAHVERSFGNKASWDRSFPDHFRTFAAEGNDARIDGRGRCRAICSDALDVEPGYDLVYLDPPYVNQSGVGVDYRSFYHFLEGMVHYDRWPVIIDRHRKHRPLVPQANPWTSGRTCHEMFRRLFDRFQRSILVVSYRSDGIPAIAELASMLGTVKAKVEVIEGGRYQYALSTKRTTREVLLIGSDA